MCPEFTVSGFYDEGSFNSFHTTLLVEVEGVLEAPTFTKS